MTTKAKFELPIGYWLKQADKMLTEQINLAQSVHHVSRTDWQILNLLHENGRIHSEQLLVTMRPFIEVDQFEKSINILMERGWIAGEAGRGDLQLTAAGQTQHGHILATQTEVRQRAMQGISQDEYGTVVRVLQQIVENLQQPASFVANQLGG
ncbi:MAG: hypothetical protein H6652_10350 [Ardenticatenaceae bacterium]|nr:hypothetical protein [Ardenticatenaceae bacterium]MCB8949405.1 hypothetical protein [Ardenticatenaceae bacterium]